MKDLIPAALGKALAAAQAILRPAFRRAVQSADSEGQLRALVRAYKSAVLGLEMRELVEARQRALAELAELDGARSSPDSRAGSGPPGLFALHDDFDVRAPLVDHDEPPCCPIP